MFSCSRVFSLLGGGILTGKEEGGGAATMAEVKPEEISHPPMEQLQGFEYCIDSNPSWGMYVMSHTTLNWWWSVAVFICV